jgi:hypothetical protein
VNFTEQELAEALEDFLESPKDAICPCEALRIVFLAYLYGEPLPECTVSAPRCHTCDVVARALAQTIQDDRQGFMELAAQCIKGNPLARVLNLLLDQPLPEVAQ